jgi:predicted mannosyl-3-phosphoglycerate phosphatase (HAD superfamily)
MANVIALSDVYQTSDKAITLAIGDEANDVGVIQVNIS